MRDSNTQKKTPGFSLVELMLVVAVMMILAAMTVPKMSTALNDIQLRYVGTDLSGLLQSARILSVQKNSFYAIQPGVVSGSPVYYIDKPGAVYAAGDAFVPVNTAITVFQGTGSGAPNEGAFLAGLKFGVNAGANPPSFSSRGLPCLAAVNSCTQNGQGFVMFMSKAAVTGDTPWVSVVVNPSGHIQVWSSDAAGNWIQRD